MGSSMPLPSSSVLFELLRSVSAHAFDGGGGSRRILPFRREGASTLASQTPSIIAITANYGFAPCRRTQPLLEREPLCRSSPGWLAR
jgi:hypothetical protein